MKKIFLIGILCLATSPAFATTIVADVGGGNWTTGATWVGGVAPTAADDAQIPVTAGNITIDSGAVCRSADFTGYVGTLTHTAGVTWTIGDATAGAGSKALDFDALMTYTLGSTTTSAIEFVSTSATVQTIDFAGQNSGNVTFNATSNGSWQLTGTWGGEASNNALVTLTKGSLDTNNQTVDIGQFTSSNSNTRSLTLGSSTITMHNGGTVWLLQVVTGLTFNSGTSTIIFLDTASFQGGGLTYNNVTWSAAGTTNTISGSNTFSNLTFTGSAIKNCTATFSANQTVTGTLTMNGNSSINRLYIQSDNIPGARTLTAATVSATNLDLEEITGAGAGSWDLSAITGLSGDCGGNSGITFTTAQNNYWVGGTGTWSVVGEWANSSGGAGASGRVPLPQDGVLFDANSISAGSQTVTVDMPRIGKDLNFTGTTNTPTINIASAATSYGVVTFIAGMTPSGTGRLTIRNRTDNNFTTGGVTGTWSYILSGISGGSITLVGNLISTATSTGGCTIAGEFDANDYNLTCNDFAFSSTPVSTASLGNGTWTATISSGNAWNSLSASTTITPEGSLIVIENTSASNKTFGGGSHTFNDFLISNSGTGSITISGNNTFSDFADDGSEAHSILFTVGSTQTVDTFTVSGTAGKLISIDSTTTGTHALVKSTAGRISRDYLDIQHSVATPDCTFFAGVNSTNDQATATAGSGWYFTTAPSTDDSLKTIKGLAHASVETCNGINMNCVKNINGLASTL